MIVTIWSQWRYLCAVKGSGTPTCTFTPPHDITRAAGTWAADGYVPNHDIDFAGTVNNNRRYTYTGIPGPAHLTVAETVVAEGPVACSFVSAFHDVDGVERWPIALVRSGGMGAITGVPTPFILVPFTCTVNASAPDAAPWTDEYDWYLSRRTDDPTKQLLNMIPKPVSGGNTYSGSVMIGESTLAMSEIGFSGITDFTPDKVPALMKYCHLYCRRRSDGAIQWIDLLRAMTADV